jgi:undecaprenyl-diphosphatase
MNVFQAIVLGVVQGISEFLPISSSGHLVLIPTLFGWEVQSRVFDVVVHLGTLLAVIIFFRKKLYGILRACLTSATPSRERTLGIFLIFATIPAAIVGLFFGDMIESVFRFPTMIAISLIVGGMVLYFADRYAAHTPSKELEALKPLQVWVIGVAQVLAFIPGMSRSGMTISAGLFQGFSKKAAAEFSFLISIPIIILAGAAGARELVVSGTDLSLSVTAITAGFFAATVSGFFSIWLTFVVVRTFSFLPFVWYRIIVGVSILIWVV